MLALFASLAVGATPTIAVADLQNNTGQERLDPAGAGAASMLVTKFSKVNGLQVVERARLAQVLDELHLSASGLVDPANAVQAGRLLGADFLAFGNVIGFDGDLVTIHLRIVEAESGKVLAAEDIQGRLGKDGSGFFQLVNNVAERIISTLQVKITPEEKVAYESVRMRQIEALLEYGTGTSAVAIESGSREAISHTCVLGKTGINTSYASNNPKLLKALQQGRGKPDELARCMRSLDESQDLAARQKFWTQVALAANSRVKARKFEHAERLTDALATRRHDAVLDPKVAKAVAATSKRREGPAIDRLEAVLALDRGVYDGAPVTASTLTSASEEELELFAARLPDEALRRDATEKLIVKRIQGSPHAWIRQNADFVRERMVAGELVVVPDDVRVVGAKLPPEVVNYTVVATPRFNGAKGSVQGGTLRVDDLQVELEGFNGWVGLCGRPKHLDPTPCVPVERLTLADPFVHLNGTRISFSSFVTVDDVIALIRRGEQFTVPLRMAGIPVSGLDVNLSYQTGSLRYQGPTGGAGPDLTVDVYELDDTTALVGVQQPGAPRQALVVQLDDGLFRLSSAGGTGPEGAKGADGQPGQPGANGVPGSCDSPATDGQPGTDGGPGGNGGPGGPGGDGGHLDILIHCNDNCSVLQRYVQEHMVSVGGNPGPGGSGGWGGDGGKGGEGGETHRANCWDANRGEEVSETIWGGSDGKSGQTGSHGSRGPDGQTGNPGTVSVRVEQR